MPNLSTSDDAGFTSGGASSSDVQISEGSFSSPCADWGSFYANFDGSDFGPLAFLNGDDRGGPTTNGKTSLTITDAAGQITRTNLSWAPGLGTAASVTFAFRSTAPTTMPADTASFTRFTDAQINATLAALQAWSDTAHITFTRVADSGGYSDSATILFGDYATGQSGAAAFAYMPGNRTASSSSGDIWVNYTGSNVSPSQLNYGQHTLTHEIGHAIGLSHPAAYNASEGVSIAYGPDATYYEDSRQFTVMSYFSEINTGANYRTTVNNYSSVPLLDDIAAAQRLYGANMTTRTGDTVYGFNSNADRAWFTASSASTVLIFAVWDAAGSDTFDFSGYTQNQTIDLRQGAFSSVGGLTGNVAIALGVVIENAIGGSGADIFRGNSADNRITGNGGADQIDGGLGTDTVIFSGPRSAYTIGWNGQTGSVTAGGVTTTITNVEFLAFADQTIAAPTGGPSPAYNTITGTEAAERLQGGSGNDAIYGLGGDDLLVGDAGDDLLVGGSGNDTMVGGGGSDSYEVTEPGDVVSEIPNEGVDTVFSYVNDYRLTANVETLVMAGSARVGSGNGLSNTLIGNALDNTLLGGAGDDVMIGGAGNDVYEVTDAGDDVRENANEGIDTVFSYLAGYALTANVETLVLVGSARNGVGNALNNTLIGNGLDNILVGGGGNDVMIGGAGNDTYEVTEAGDEVRENAGEGSDTVFSYIDGYQLADNVETLALVGSARLGLGNSGNNTLFGNTLDNTLLGGAGNDLMIGGSGNDVYEVTEVGDEVRENANEGVDTVFSYVNDYRLTANVETLVMAGSARVGSGNGLSNTLIGNALDNTLLGGAGDDVMIGGAGNDVYEVTDAGDDVRENANEGIDTVFSYLAGYALTANVETLVLVGSARNGVGNALNNTLIGNGLDNILVGGGGNDVMIGGAGNDTYEVTEAGDEVRENAGEGSDTVFSYIDGYQLADNVETLALVGSARLGLGNSGNNTLIGNALDNVLNGNGGADALTGGGGVDTFWHLGSAAGNDRITDFAVANEVIVLSTSSYADFAAVQAHAAQVGANVVITLNASTSLTLENTLLTQLKASNFAFYSGPVSGVEEPSVNGSLPPPQEPLASAKIVDDHSGVEVTDTHSIWTSSAELPLFDDPMSATFDHRTHVFDHDWI